MKSHETVSAAPIPSLPFIGTTWVRRGPAYWFRRGLAAMLAYIIFLAFAGVIAALYAGTLHDATGAWRIILPIAYALCIVWSVIAAIRSYIRQQEARKAGQAIDNREANKRGIARGVGLGTAARAGSPIASVFIFVGALFGIGWFALFAFLLTFRKYMGPQELEAIQQLNEWRARHPESSR